MKKILVTGATGQLGTAVIDHLIKNTDVQDIVAFAREENKIAALQEKHVEVRMGSFDDLDSLKKAFKDIDKVLLISTGDLGRFQQHKNVVDAAVAAGTSFIVYTSVSIKDIDTSAAKAWLESHFETEEYIRQSGLTYTFLRNNIYADMIPVYAGANALETGIHLPAGTGRLPFALRREMGEAAANVLLQSERHKDQVYDITNKELYSFSDIAKVLSELSGKEVSYDDESSADYKTKLENAGLPKEKVAVITAFIEDFKNHQYEVVTNDLEHLLGRAPTALTEALEELYHLKLIA